MMKTTLGIKPRRSHRALPRLSILHVARLRYHRRPRASVCTSDHSETHHDVERSAEIKPSDAAQLDIFGFADVTQEMYEALEKAKAAKHKPKKAKRKRRRLKGKRRRSKRKPGPLQYRMAIPTRLTPRVIRFHRKEARDHALKNTETWTEHGMRKLHYILLLDSIKSIRDHASLGSSRACEIWLWASRTGCAEPFAFETCVEIAGEFDPDYIGADPDALRNLLSRLIRKAYGEIPMHHELLRRAVLAVDAGDADALAWMKSDAADDLSFNDCCMALGFDPAEVRDEILPVSDDLEQHAA
jgi:hypothetical protein